jgi:hypothetical protein
MKKSKIFIPILIVIVIILFIGCGIAFSGSSSSSPTVSQTTVPETTITETTTVIETESSSVEAQSTNATAKANDTSAYDFYKKIEKSSFIDFEINYAAANFLKTHADLFPTDNPSNITDDLMDYTIRYENISKAPDKYGNKLIYVDSLKVVQIKEQPFDGRRITWLNVSDSNNNYYTIFYRGELPDIMEDSTINVFGLPLAYSSYDNTRGGSTLTLVLAGSYISLYGTTYSAPVSNNAITSAQSNSAEYILPDSSTKYFTIDDVNWLKTDEIRLAINEIYARHGRMFKSEELQNYFNSKSWYNPSIPADQFDDSVLNDCERHNIQVLQTVQ